MSTDSLTYTVRRGQVFSWNSMMIPPAGFAFVPTQSLYLSSAPLPIVALEDGLPWPQINEREISGILAHLDKHGDRQADLLRPKPAKAES